MFPTTSESKIKASHEYHSDYFTYFEAIIGYRTTPRPGYLSKKAYNCRLREFRAVMYVNTCVP